MSGGLSVASWAIALERLRGGGYALAILSNGDRDMLEAAMPHVGVRFDHVISVQEAGAFKPHWRTYAKAAEIIGVDRRSRPFGETPHSPDLIVEDATVLAAALA